jgi:Phosphodiester glycosidase
MRFRSTISALLGAVFVLLGSTVSVASDCVIKRSASFESTRCDQDRLWVIETRRPMVPIYHAVGPLTLRQLADADKQFALLVNGSYHDGDYTNARLEGLFVVNGKTYAPLKSLDKQLSHVVSFSSSGMITSVSLAVETAHVASQWKAGTHIQTGPLITEAGSVTPGFIDAAINGKDRYKRTAIGATADGATVIVIAKTPYSLHELARAVLAINRYRERKLTLVNFDGGPSTALHSNEQSGLSYQADKLTPILFGLRR